MFCTTMLCTTSRTFRASVCRRGLSAAASKKGSGEIDMAQVGKQHDANMRLCLKILNSIPDETDDRMTEEEKVEYHEAMKEYNKRFRERYLAQEKARQIRLQCMHDAIEGLPEECKAFARTPDLSLPDLDRRVLVETPPIPDFKRGKNN